MYNLEKNEGLTKSLFQGEISPRQLLTMENKDLASSELKDLRRTQSKEEFTKTTLQGKMGYLSENWIETNDMKCSKCGRRKCKYLSRRQVAQSRKSEVWGNKSHEDMQMVQVVCNSCDYTWKEETFY